MSAGILPIEEPAAAAIVQEALARDGVQLLLSSRDLTITGHEDGHARLAGEAADGPYAVDADRVLVAAGRIPNTDGLGLDAAGVAFDRKGVRVDDHLRTTNPRIFAAGDIASKYQLTHAADAMARIVVRNALFGLLPFTPKGSKLVVPWCTYTTPEIAHVGAYPHELEEAGTRFETVTVDVADNDRAILESETAGLLNVHVAPNGRILGATLVSRHAGESIGEITQAMVHGLKLQKLASVIHPYPTQAEVIKRAADTWFKRWLLQWKDRILFWK
ncbi:MAG: FAD-dependent oxidoreductase [Planctomycetota bacterium]|nr:FAD-dependent oxidoreductase [Planctomycetota bacterium]